MYPRKERKVTYISISVLDYYILKKLLPAFIFYLIICSILGELIGISFEQVRFVVEQDLPLKTVFLVHLLKLPSFMAVAFPFALLIASLSIYSQLTSNNEIAALQSFGVSLIRLILPSLAIAFFVSIVMFGINEAVVPPANYQAAMLLEREWGVDRSSLAKYNNQNIVYSEFNRQPRSDRLAKDDKQQRYLDKIFFAERFDGQKMKGVTLIEYQNAKITRIVVARSAQWIKQQQWQLSFGTAYELDRQMTYSQVNNFERLSLRLSKNILDYADNNRDDREMNILELTRQLAVVKNTNNVSKIRQLEASIQSRYVALCSCGVFTFLGSTLGLSLKAKNNGKSLGLATIVIFIYYSTQFIGNSLVLTGTVTVFIGVWLPSAISLLVGYLRLRQIDN